MGGFFKRKTRTDDIGRLEVDAKKDTSLTTKVLKKTEKNGSKDLDNIFGTVEEIERNKDKRNFFEI